MTDPITNPDDGFQIVAVLTPEFAAELLERVVALEGNVPATVPAEDDDEPVTLATLQARLDRHRVELEAIKTWAKGVSRFLGLPTSTTPTTTSEASQ